MTGAVAMLSLGFLGQSPLTSPGDRRHVSSCGDGSKDPVASSSSLPAFPTGLFSYVQDDAVRQAAEAYSLFVRQLQVNAALGSFTAPSMFGFPMPAFPSYAMPDLAQYQVDLRKPDSSHQIFGGLSARPELQYLIRPAAAPAQASVGSATSLDGLITLAKLPSETTTPLNSRNNLAATFTVNQLKK